MIIKVSIEDVINPSSNPTNELVISTHKNMNNGNNSKIMKNNIVESYATLLKLLCMIPTKINDAEKGTKENQTRKLVVNNKKKKVFKTVLQAIFKVGK